MRFDLEGRMTPLEIRWEDGTRYEIDRVLNVRRWHAQTKLPVWVTGIRRGPSLMKILRVSYGIPETV